jgi:ribosomal subunit interface protein
MTLRVSGKNLDIGEALRTHVENRIDAAVVKYAVGRLSGHVTIEPEGSGYRSDCTLHLASGLTLQVEAEAHEPYASFNLAAERIEKRLRRHHRRRRDHHGNDMGNAHAVAAADGREALTDDERLDDDDDAADMLAPRDGDSAPVIAERLSDVAQMPVSEAIMDLDRRRANLVLFRHPADGHMSLVYRRPDGLIGWIDRLPA